MSQKKATEEGLGPNPSRFFVNIFLKELPEDSPFKKYIEEMKNESLLNERLIKKRDELLELVCLKHQKLDSFNDVSIYTGLGGVAYTFFHLSLTNNEKEKDFLEKSDFYIQYCLNSKRKMDRISFIIGHSGIYALASVVWWKLGKKKESEEALENIKKIRDIVKETVSMELLYGQVGYLFALLFVQQYGNEKTKHDSQIQALISFVFEDIVRAGKNFNDKNSPLMYSWHGKKYFGAAHGISGILYVLFHCPKELIEKYKELFQQTLEYLLSFETYFPSGNYPSNPESKSDDLVQWCHGSPGFVFLFIAAYKIFGDIKYLNAAKRASIPVWKYGLLRKGLGLCHGISGNAYVFLTLYQVTKEKVYLNQAIQFCYFGLEKEKELISVPDTPYSLFEGVCGMVCLCNDLLYPLQGKFPAFQLS